MRIRINKEKFINHQCPAIPKDLMDVFYSKLMERTRYRLPEDLKVIETIDIRVNQAYAGCSNFHFYVSYNGLEEIHIEVHTYDEPKWSIKDRNGNSFREKTHPRGEWLVDFEKHLGLDVGPHKMNEKIQAVWDRINLKQKSSKITKRLKQQWQSYLSLKEYFGV